MKKTNVLATCMAAAFLIFTMSANAQSQDLTKVIPSISKARDDNGGNDVPPPPPPALGIDETGNTDLSFYPNPCNGILHIRIGSSEPKTIMVYNLLGTLLMKQQVNHTTKLLDLSNLRSGIYIINDGNKSYRLEKV